MTFLFNTWQKKFILAGLSVHFAFWWTLSAWFWTKGYGWNLWSIMAPIAPVYLGIFCLPLHGNWHLGATGILASFGLIGTTFFSIENRKCWTVLLSHVIVLLYWLVGFVLIATGV